MHLDVTADAEMLLLADADKVFFLSTGLIVIMVSLHIFNFKRLLSYRLVLIYYFIIRDITFI